MKYRRGPRGGERGEESRAGREEGEARGMKTVKRRGEGEELGSVEPGRGRGRGRRGVEQPDGGRWK